MTAITGRYTAPGVYTQSVPGPVVGTTSDAPNSLGIFGAVIGSQSAQETVFMPDEDEDFPTLSNYGIIRDSVRIRDPFSDNYFTEGDDYILTEVALPGARETNRRTLEISFAEDGELLPGSTVDVSYRFRNENYFEVREVYSHDEVVDLYGQPFSNEGDVQSEVSLAARIAFLNGASSLVISPARPNEQGQVNFESYENALNRLQGHDDIAIVVCANGDQRYHTLIKSHVNIASNNGNERRAIVGVDGSASRILSTQRREFARGLKDRRIMMVSPDRVRIALPTSGDPVSVGGHYLAVAAAAYSVTQSPAQPLTRKSLVGFYDFEDVQPNSEKNLEANAGLAVVETIRGGGMRVRHGLTTNLDTLFTREWSITGQEDAMVYLLRSTLDSDGIIGSIIDDLTLGNVKGSVDSALMALSDSGSIRDFRGLQVRQLVSEPDVVEVRFEWQPSTPLNYISVRYSVSITSGDMVIQSDQANDE